MLPFNAWPAFVAATVAGSIPGLLPDELAGQSMFFAAIKYNFYAIFAVLGTLAVALGVLPWMGRTLRAARDRAIDRGLLDREGAQPMVPDDQELTERDTSYTPHIVDFAVPLSALLGIAIGSYAFTGSAWVDEAFSSALILAMAVAWIRGMTLASATRSPRAGL